MTIFYFPCKNCNSTNTSLKLVTKFISDRTTKTTSWRKCNSCKAVWDYADATHTNVCLR